MYESITHVALCVEDVAAAEQYYCSLLALEVAFRDIEVEGEWFGLRPEYDWEAADGANAQVCALGRGNLVLALESGRPTSEASRLQHIGLRVSFDDLQSLRIRVAEHEIEAEITRPDLLVFSDRFGVRWEVGIAAYDDPSSMGTGPRTGRWWP